MLINGGGLFGGGGGLNGLSGLGLGNGILPVIAPGAGLGAGLIGRRRRSANTSGQESEYGQRFDSALCKFRK